MLNKNKIARTPCNNFYHDIGIPETILDTQSFVQERIKKYYGNDDLSCTTANLKILSEKFNIKLSDQVYDSAVGMHGAGEYGAQCGLVEGTLMFLGIIGRLMHVPDEETVYSCNEFARKFEKQFSSLLCSILRPQGFHPNNPPHICEGLTCKAICFNIEFVGNFITKYYTHAR